MQLNLFEQNVFISKSDIINNNPDVLLIEKLDFELERYFNKKIIVEPNLNRKTVSFQGNKTKPQYRWFKYKEAFSADLVEYLIKIQKNPNITKILDPFAGVGTTLFVCSQLGIKSDGIELLPIGQEVIKIRKLLNSFNNDDFLRVVFWQDNKPWKSCTKKKKLNQLKITEEAYPPETHESIEQYLYLLGEEKKEVGQVLLFALISILESISYTQKDGQYLRWDRRANRQNGSKKFNKGEILEFDLAITEQIERILLDSYYFKKENFLFSDRQKKAHINLFEGSCLQILPTLQDNIYEGIITSPPYCNRYDYTRTYALELAILGIDQKELIQFRQNMLSCTVENKEKSLIQNWKQATLITDKQELLQKILNFLEYELKMNNLNNKGIPRMVRGYFYEMSCVIAECFRVLKSGAYLYMVNDNVRYAGVNISVDLILCDIAEKLGFNVEKILVLPTTKGNSSQQMGVHGRKPLRKCIYVWRKP